MKLFIVALLPAVALCQLGGGISQSSADQVPDAAMNFAMNSINDKFAATNGGHTQNLKLVNVVKARQQVVNGMNYFLTLHVTGDMVCDVTVWYRSYLNTPEALQVTAGPTCHPLNMPAARPRVGGESAPKPLDTTDAGIMNVLSFAACAYNNRSNAMFASTFGEMSGVTFTSQVTSGMTYRFQQVPLVETECLKSHGCASMDDYSACNAKTSGMKSTCAFTVQSQPWMNPPITLTSMTC